MELIIQEIANKISNNFFKVCVKYSWARFLLPNHPSILHNKNIAILPFATAVKPKMHSIFIPGLTAKPSYGVNGILPLSFIAVNY